MQAAEANVCRYRARSASGANYCGPHLVALRVIFGETASLDLTGREYFVSKVGAAARGGHDNVVRVDASFTVRV